MVPFHIRHGVIGALALLAGACGPLGAGDMQPDRLTGIWQIERIGDAPLPLLGEGLNQVEIEAGRLMGRLACSYVEADIPAGRIDRASVRMDGTKCPAEDIAAARELVAVLADPAAQWQLDADRLQIGAPGGTVWSRLPGSDGPKGDLAGITGFWRLRSIDGAPPLPGLDDSLQVGVGFDAFRVGAYSGCNGGGTRILWESGGFRSEGPFMATAMGCETLRRQEDRIFGILTDRPRLSLQGDLLRVTGQGGGELLLVRP